MLMRALLPQDKVAGSHRSHHHALARGLPPAGVMAELYGRATGVSQGRGGTMHLARLADWVSWAATASSAPGSASPWASRSPQASAPGSRAVGFVGDGGMNTGRTWEFVEPRRRLASPADHRLREQPLCRRDTEHAADRRLLDRGAGGGVRHPRVRRRRPGRHRGPPSGPTRAARAAGGDGPTFIEARTYRYEGHSTGQADPLPDEGRGRGWRETRDPITRLAARWRRGPARRRASARPRGARRRAVAERDRVRRDLAPAGSPADAAADVTGMDLRVRGNTMTSDHVLQGVRPGRPRRDGARPDASSSWARTSSPGAATSPS